MESHNGTESGDDSDDNSTLPTLSGEVKMYELSSVDEYDTQPMPTDMLEDIRGEIKSHPSIKRRKARYNIRDCIKQSQSEWKGTLLSTRYMVKGSHKVLKAAVN